MKAFEQPKTKAPAGGSNVSTTIPKSQEPTLPARAAPALGKSLVDVPVSAPEREVPYRDEMEQRFQTSFRGVAAYVGERASLQRLGARGLAAPDKVLFASSMPSREVVAHELAHIEQLRRSPPPAQGSVTPHGHAAEIEATEVARAVAEGTSAVAVSAPAGGVISFDDDKPDAWGHTDKRPELLADFGNTRIRDARTAHDEDVKRYGDRTITINEDYAFGVQGDREVGSDAVFAVHRTYLIEIYGTVAEVDIMSRAHLKLDRVPSDITTLVDAPAMDGSSNIGEITFVRLDDPATGRMLGGEPHQPGQSLADMIRDDRLIAFESTPKERIDALITRTTVIRELDLQAAWLREIDPQVKQIIAALEAHKASIENYEDGMPHVLDTAADSLRALALEHDRLVSNYQRGAIKNKEALKQIRKLEDMYDALYAAYLRADEAKPRKKSVGEHLGDIAVAPAHAVKAMGEGVVELGKMGYDATLGTAQWIGEWTGFYHFEFDAKSGFGKASQEGKSTGEIAFAMWEGFCDQLHEAIIHAKNGDFSKLDDFTAGLALDVALALPTAGGEPAAAWTARAAKTAKRFAAAGKSAVEAAVELAKRMKTLAADAREVIAAAGKSGRRWAAQRLEAIARTLEEVGEGVGPRAATVGAEGGGGTSLLPSPTEAGAMLRKNTLAEVSSDAAKTLTKRGVGKGKQALHVADFVTDLEKLGTSVGRESDVAKVLKALESAKKNVKGYANAVNDVMKARGIASDDLVGILLRSRHAADPAEFLQRVARFSERKISGLARSNILKRVAAGKAPDLAWLEKLSISDQWLEFLGSNPATNWKTFMKVSQEASDMFPTKLAKRAVTAKDYIDAAIKLRGIAGELVVDEMTLPGGLRVVKRQVNVGTRTVAVAEDAAVAEEAQALGKVLDFELVDASGKPAWLEVKGWSAKRWKAQLKAIESGGDTGPLEHLFAQLDAAKASGNPTYLAVTDALEASTRDAVTALLQRRGYKVELIEFSDTRLKDIARKLRVAFALSAGVSTLIDLDLDADNAEDSSE